MFAVNIKDSVSKLDGSIVEITNDPLDRCACYSIVMDEVAHLVLDVVVLLQESLKVVIAEVSSQNLLCHES